ncbi:Flp pilus assembly protein TadD [Tumebacillus sp. BK434]|uniref:tetratricopeptide repeat protein n=1 Tax=Tumebacillus sp. BK434 TaxID=2512169 RepID=UPI0010F2B5B3|nr:tetratricopeptide repeat protein [Tumebacillus sp. BK434]TCP59285.1 Flp pilus assembly protein TadD [Tumebacillus sp. BK434]
MFEKPFELLNRAVDRIEVQLQSADADQKRILGDELVALRSACDKFVERWLAFEERVTELGESHSLDLDGTLPTEELQAMQQKLSAMQAPYVPPTGPEAEQTGATAAADGDSESSELPSANKKVILSMGEGSSIRPADEQMVRSFRRGIGFFDLLMFPEAMNEFHRVIELDETFTIARLYLAFGYLAEEKYQEASRHLNLLKLEDDDELIKATVHGTFGQIFAAQGQYRQALIEFEAARKLVPDFRDIEFNMGCCHFNLGEHKEALMNYQRALIVQPEDWEAHRLCGLIYVQLGNRERAYRHLARAYDLNGAQEEVILEFARLSEQLGQKEQASALYQKALRYHPESAAAYGGLGWIKMREGDHEAASALFKKQLSCKPNDMQGLFNLGWAAYHRREYPLAERCFAQLLSRNARDPFALSGLARTWSMTGKRAEAKEQLLQLVALESTAEKKLGLYHLGRLALEEEAYLQALRYFNAALVYERNCIESLFFKGVAHFALGEQERADQCFEKCKRLTTLRESMYA